MPNRVDQRRDRWGSAKGVRHGQLGQEERYSNISKMKFEHANQFDSRFVSKVGNEDDNRQDDCTHNYVRQNGYFREELDSSEGPSDESTHGDFVSEVEMNSADNIAKDKNVDTLIWKPPDKSFFTSDGASMEGEEDESKNADSEEIDKHWDMLRENPLSFDTTSPRSKLLAVDSTSPRSMSVDMKEALIQDCMDTGLPSPVQKINSMIPTDGGDWDLRNKYLQVSRLETISSELTETTASKIAKTSTRLNITKVQNKTHQLPTKDNHTASAAPQKDRINVKHVKDTPKNFGGPSKLSESMKSRTVFPSIEVRSISSDGCNSNRSVGLEHNNKRSQDESAEDATKSRNESDKNQRVSITGPKKTIEKVNRVKQKDQKKSERFIDEIDGEAAIVDVLSSLTGSFSNHDTKKKEKNYATSKPVLKKSSKPLREHDEKDGLGDLSVSFEKGRSFGSGLTASQPGVPSWRMKPSESLANFTLQILNQGSGEVDEYHVHKHVLAVGPRRSEHLDAIFRSKTLSSTRISLEENAAKVFPLFLDYFYCHDFEISITTETAVAYRNLAHIFKVTSLLAEAAGFILRDVAISNMSTYIVQSNQFKDQKVMKHIIAKCADEVEKIRISDPMWSVMEPEQFLRVLSWPDIDRKKLSSHLSTLVVEYQTLHSYELDLTMIGMLTSEEIIPVIDRQAALPLLEICEEYGSPEQFLSLQQRCTHTMACYWKVASENDRRRLFALLRGLPSSFTVDFLETIETGKSATMVNVLKAGKCRNGDSGGISKIADFGTLDSFSDGSLNDDLLREERHPTSSGAESQLTWRMDPEISHSDWEIRVAHSEKGKPHVYHVHKHMLSIGPYKSLFFANQFLADGEDVVRRGTTNIHLVHPAALLFPRMLDFMYSQEHELKISRKTAVALRFLSRVFGVWMLNQRAIDFVKKDISLSNVLEYLKHSETFDDAEVTSIAAHMCAKELQAIGVDSHLLHALKPDFFAKIISSDKIQRDARCHVCVLICRYFTLHNLDESLLAKFLMKMPPPEIDSSSALELLPIIDSMKSKETEVFSKLRARCSNVVVENWKDMRQTHREKMMAIFRDLDSAVVTDIFDKVESEYSKQEQHTMSLQTKLVKRYRKQLSDSKKQREEEVARLKKLLDEKTAEMTAIQNELQKLPRRHREKSNRGVASSACSIKSSGKESGILTEPSGMDSLGSGESMSATTQIANSQNKSSVGCRLFSCSDSGKEA